MSAFAGRRPRCRGPAWRPPQRWGRFRGGGTASQTGQTPGDEAGSQLGTGRHRRPRAQVAAGGRRARRRFLGDHHRPDGQRTGTRADTPVVAAASWGWAHDGEPQGRRRTRPGCWGYRCHRRCGRGAGSRRPHRTHRMLAPTCGSISILRGLLCGGVAQKIDRSNGDWGGGKLVELSYIYWGRSGCSVAAGIGRNK